MEVERGKGRNSSQQWSQPTRVTNKKQKGDNDDDDELKRLRQAALTSLLLARSKQNAKPEEAEEEEEIVIAEGMNLNDDDCDEVVEEVILDDDEDANAEGDDETDGDPGGQEEDQTADSEEMEVIIEQQGDDDDDAEDAVSVCSTYSDLVVPDLDEDVITRKNKVVILKGDGPTEQPKAPVPKKLITLAKPANDRRLPRDHDTRRRDLREPSRRDDSSDSLRRHRNKDSKKRRDRDEDDRRSKRVPVMDAKNTNPPSSSSKRNRDSDRRQRRREKDRDKEKEKSRKQLESDVASLAAVIPPPTKEELIRREARKRKFESRDQGSISGQVIRLKTSDERAEPARKAPVSVVTAVPAKKDKSEVPTEKRRNKLKNTVQVEELDGDDDEQQDLRQRIVNRKLKLNSSKNRLFSHAIQGLSSTSKKTSRHTNQVQK